MDFRLILASGSPFRRQLLKRLHRPFEVVPAGIDETRHPRESAGAMARRLAEAKAAAVRERLAPGAQGPLLVIGSDQTVELDDDVLGKPGGFEAACVQLKRLSGRAIAFHTGLSLMSSEPGREWHDLVTVQVTFRVLDVGEIERYVRREEPYGSAGAFQVEGYGISLVEAIESDDPTALIGLPLVRLCHMLRTAGLAVP